MSLHQTTTDSSNTSQVITEWTNLCDLPHKGCGLGSINGCLLAVGGGRWPNYITTILPSPTPGRQLVDSVLYCCGSFALIHHCFAACLVTMQQGNFLVKYYLMGTNHVIECRLDPECIAVHSYSRQRD